MLTIFGKPHKNGGYCDGMSRRDFLTIGGTVMGGLSLSKILAAEAKQNLHSTGTRLSHRAIINIFLPGGPPHQDMWDIKTEAPDNIRGEYKPIHTNVPGIQVGELFPNIARTMDRFVVIRSMTGCNGGHDAYQCMTGRNKNPQMQEFWPSLGSWVSRLQGPADPSVPANVSLMYPVGHKEWGDPYSGGFLGLAHSPFRLVGPAKDKKANGFNSQNMALNGVTLNQLDDRMALMKSFDGLKRDMDRSGVIDGMDAFTNQALGILTDSKLVNALDLSKEDPKIVARYGEDKPEFVADAAPRMVRNFCIARRLVEAGARVVTLNFSRWDWHGGNFKRGREDMPMLDKAVAALVDDLYERGLQNDVSVVVWGEFGRTPKINNKAGRDHWPRVSTALLAGGGMKTGKVIGATNRLGEYAVDRPVSHAEVFATLYRNIGLDRAEERIFDPFGRPQAPIEEGVQPLREVY